MSTLDKYIPQRRNANKHTQRGMGELERSVQTDGWIGAITAAADGEIFDGSARREVVETALHAEPIIVPSDGTRPIIIQRTDIPTATDPRAIRLGLAANKIAADNLDWDAEVLKELQEQDASLLAGLFGDDELDALLATLDQPIAPGDGGDEFDTTPDEGPTRTNVGELWSLGRHKLLIGDCTDPANVTRLMDGKQFEMLWTDPPYGVGIGDKNKYLNSVGRSNRIEENLVNDTLDEPGLQAMLYASFALAAQYGLAGGAWYVAAPAGPLHVLFGLILKEMNIWHQTIQWVKNNATFSPMGVDYHWRAEPIFYGWLPGAAHRYYGGRKQDTVWEIDRPMASPDHPTMKPIELVQRAVENSSRRDELVYDPFLGSGTSIIAAERTGRTCYGCEIEPCYADVILRRFTAETGIEPTLIGRTGGAASESQDDGTVDRAG